MTRTCAIALATVAAACGDAADAPASSPVPPGFVALRDVTARTGIDFVHRNGATKEKRILETMPGGVTVIDYDGDGLQDLYFVDSGDVPPSTARQAPGRNRLYRNLGGWKFEDVSAKAGASGRGFMMGAVVGDYDNDGNQDLYVTAYGSNTLYRNRGDGTFEDATVAAHCDDARWSTGAAFFDYDRDGDLDLFVQNYVQWTVESFKPAFQQNLPAYPVPDLYDPVANSLFENQGDGTFVDVSERSGIGAQRGKGLGVVAADLDDDGDQDVYCANDAMANQLFENRGDKTFRETGALSGAAYSEEGREESGMGVDAADLDGDGHFDLVVTNFAGEPNSIYRGEGGLFFTEISARTGTWEAAVPALGFGVRCLDLDDDGWHDMVVANGHINDNAEQVANSTYRQPPLLFRGVGKGRFEDVLATQPAEFRAPKVGRGLAAADLDQDGDQDLVFGILAGRPQVFENDGGNAKSWLAVRCLGTKRDSTAIGARVTVEAEGRRMVQEVRSGGSYLSQSDLRLFFGLGAAAKAERVVVRWPDGSLEELRDVPARQHIVVAEGRGLVH